MGLYHEGYGEALAKVDRMNEGECLAVMDSLFSRGDLRCDDDIYVLRAEVRRQLEREFRNEHDDRWPLVEAVKKASWTRYGGLPTSTSPPRILGDPPPTQMCPGCGEQVPEDRRICPLCDFVIWS